MTEPLIILAGGQGTRLKSVFAEGPKVLAPAAGRPFLAWLLESLHAQGARRCILSLGYGAEAVQAFLAQDRALPPDLEVQTVTEPRPLGTGGAVCYAARALGLRGHALVLNGDTYLATGYAEFVREPPHSGCEIALVRVDDVSRFGAVTADAEGHVERFAEKGGQGPGWIYAGLCRVDLAELGALEPESFSLELDFLAPRAARGCLFSRRLDSSFVDIGVPADYKGFCDKAAAADKIP